MSAYAASDASTVNLYSDPDAAPYACSVPVCEAFPDDDDRADVLSALRTQGQAWVGGGASPAVFVALASDDTTQPQPVQQAQAQDVRAETPSCEPGDTAAHVARAVAAGWYQERVPIGRALDGTTWRQWRNDASPDVYPSAHQVCLALGDNTAPVFVSHPVQPAQARDFRVTFTVRNDNPNTIWNRLAARIGREPTAAEARAEVRRILRGESAPVEAAALAGKV